jgi:hypothetical protein
MHRRARASREALRRCPGMPRGTSLRPRGERDRQQHHAERAERGDLQRRSSLIDRRDDEEHDRGEPCSQAQQRAQAVPTRCGNQRSGEWRWKSTNWYAVIFWPTRRAPGGSGLRYTSSVSPMPGVAAPPLSPKRNDVSFPLSGPASSRTVTMRQLRTRARGSASHGDLSPSTRRSSDGAAVLWSQPRSVPDGRVGHEPADLLRAAAGDGVLGSHGSASSREGTSTTQKPPRASG